MKTHFSLGSLIFYAGAIAVVVVLFTFTTAYGEKNLQAPRRIDGRYPLALQGPTDCLQGQSPQLLLQQSGIFLTGALLPANVSESAQRIAQERPSLTGRWENNQITLNGNLGRDWSCTATVAIAGTLDQNTLKGTLNLSEMSAPISFSGDRQLAQPKEESH